MKYTHVFLIGGMKCGTWTTFKLLRRHPRIAHSRPKELKFFSKNDRSQWGAYHDHFEINEKTKILFDGTTQYAKHPDTTDIAYNISRFDPKAKFIYMMRDPVKRVESQLAHRVARDEIKTDAKSRAAEISKAINYSRYFTQMGIYANIFGPEQIYAQTFERLISDQEGVARECFAFLGVKQPKKVEALPPQNVRRTDRGAEKIELTDAEKARIRKALYWEVRCLETAFGVDTSKWHTFWDS